MTLEQGTADLIRALAPYAWPLAAVIIAALLKSHLGDFIDRVARRARKMTLRSGNQSAEIELGDIEEEATEKTASALSLAESIRRLLNR